MKLKVLESLLEDVEPFREPNVMLEQYPTGAHLAARVVHEAHARGDVEDRAVVDLGVGGGVLSAACALMGARGVVGVDVDPAALELARENFDAFDPPLDPELVLGRVPEDVLAWARAAEAPSSGAAPPPAEPPASSPPPPPSRQPSSLPLRADTVVMNPPFGTRVKGADMGFLRAALAVARPGGAVYSLHKSSTRAHVEKIARVVFRAARAEVLAEMRYDLPRTYAHQREANVEIEVDLWRFEPPEDGVVGGATETATTRPRPPPRRGEEEEGDDAEISSDASSSVSDASSLADRLARHDLDEPAGRITAAEAERRRGVKLEYAGERNAFCDRRGFEPRGAFGRSGGKGARGAERAGRAPARGRGGGRGGRGGGRGK